MTQLSIPLLIALAGIVVFAVGVCVSLAYERPRFGLVATGICVILLVVGYLLNGQPFAIPRAF